MHCASLSCFPSAEIMEMESMSLTTSGQGLLEPLEGASADEHWRSETAFMV